VALFGGDDQVCKITLPRPFATDADASDDLPLGQRLVMFGASRREMIGVRVEATGRDDETKLSYMGDCGALYLDENGIPRCMHTAIQGVPADNPTVWTSRGAELQDIVNSHSFYFGHAPNDGVNGRQSSPFSIRLETIIDPETKGKYPIPYFEDEEGDCYIERRALSFSEARRHGIQVYFSDEDDDDNDDDDDDNDGPEEYKKRED
jgi:hypothetical protein